MPTLPPLISPALNVHLIIPARPLAYGAKRPDARKLSLNVAQQRRKSARLQSERERAWSRKFETEAWMECKLDITTAMVEDEISRIQTLKPDAVRSLWRDTFKREVPKTLTRDLLVRTLCWHIQEKALGGHDRATLQVFARYGKGRSDALRDRRLKPGTEIVREHQGERHTVVVTDRGFRWREGDYSSLTAIAQAITGTNWNGPRFFGLRGRPEIPGEALGPTKTTGRNKRASATPTDGAHGRAPQTVPLLHLHPQIDRP